MIKLVALIAGLLFGLGLAVSGMTDTYKVIGFLDIFGDWDASLAFVMGAAVITTGIGYRVVLSKPAPRLDDVFHLPTKQDIDKPLLIGGLLFGVGWGLYGYCPGPAVASLAYLQTDSVLFVVAMLIGMFTADRFKTKLGW